MSPALVDRRLVPGDLVIARHRGNTYGYAVKGERSIRAGAITLPDDVVGLVVSYNATWVLVCWSGGRCLWHRDGWLRLVPARTKVL